MSEADIFIVAGEASGDQRGAEIAGYFTNKHPELTLAGIGGEAMRTAGVNTFFDINDLAVMGFVEPLLRLPHIYKVYKTLCNKLKQHKPKVIILVDYPGFNLKLAAAAKKMGIKVLFYISPQIWAWRQNRIHKIARLIDYMAVVFPFEVDIYQKHHVPVSYVGHPLVKKLAQQIPTATAKQQLGFTENQRIVTLMPGSRLSEVSQLLPIMLQAVERLTQTFDDLQFVLPRASTIDNDKIASYLNDKQLPLMVTDNSWVALCAADAVISASGTATLETALLQKPMVVIYKVGKLTAFIAKRVIKIPYISLCNIVAGKKIVQELLQEEANATQISNEIAKILQDSNYRHIMLKNLADIRKNFSDKDAAKEVGTIALQLMSEQNGHN